MRRKSTLKMPAATNLAVVGELVPGGSVRASFLYWPGETEAEEMGTTCRWFIDETPYAETAKLDFSITYDFAGKTLRFSVIPRSSQGEVGKEAISQIYRIGLGYQNISDEESECSFLKQRGNFAIYSNEPSDRIFISNGGAYSVMDGSSQSVIVKGNGSYAGTPAPEIIQYLQNNPATRIYSTEKDFAALVPVLGSTTRLMLWGSNIGALPPELDLNNIRFVYSNLQAFAWIYDSPPPGWNTIGAFGAAASGGVVPDEIQRALLFDKPKAIYAAPYSFTVLTEAGRVYSWGNRDNGGFISATVRTQLDRIHVEKIISSGGAFCAVGPERFADPNLKTFVTWGSTQTGGIANPTDIEAILDDDGVDLVVASRNAFCALTKRRRKAVSWGGAEGGVMSAAARELSARGGIVMCKASAYAFCMANRFGNFEAWGRVEMGGSTPSLGKQTEEEVENAEDVLNASGEKPRIEAMFKRMNVDEWYQESLRNTGSRCVCDELGNRNNRLDQIVTVSGVITIHSNDTSFFLRSQHPDGRTDALITWGNSSFGGSIPEGTRQVLMASKITNVQCSNGSYGIISTQGEVQGAVNAFGGSSAQNEAGQVPEDLKPYLESGVQELYSIKQMPPFTPSIYRLSSGLVARRENGSYVVWGARNLVVNEVILPK